MQTAEIFGSNYTGQSPRTRIACRGIIIDNGKILLSHEVNTGIWMTPGGGLEGDETLEECCVREVGEETGLLVEAQSPFFMSTEYYAQGTFINYAHICEVVGTAQIKLTQREEKAGSVAEWMNLEKAFELFSKYDELAELRRGIFLREHTILEAYRELVG